MHRVSAGVYSSHMDKTLLKQALGWGFLLWLFGYALGMILFFMVPSDLIGWFITPFGMAATIWVLWKKIASDRFIHYVALAFVWTLIAVVCDYLFLVKVLQPADGYYKLDVYLYYALTFVLPLLAGWRKGRRTAV